MEPISVSAESIWNNFTKPLQLYDGLAYPTFQKFWKFWTFSKAPWTGLWKVPGRDLWPLLISSSAWQFPNPCPPGDMATMPRWRNAVWARGSRISWMCLFTNAVSINSSKAIIAKKETTLGALRISNAGLRLSRVWDALLVSHIYNDYCLHHTELLQWLLTDFLPSISFHQSCVLRS